MLDIIHRLSRIERVAQEVYGDAATFFLPSSPPLSEFLADQSSDEGEHYRVMTTAARLVAGDVVRHATALALDPQTEARILAPFRRIREGLSAGTLAVGPMLAGLVEAESSEWNDFFLFVVETLKRDGREFQAAASKIQAHRRKTERFLNAYPEYREHLDALRSAPRVWTPAVLVVEDSMPVAELLQSVLARLYVVDSAEDGALALRKACGRHFDVILSDVEMPNMNGIEFHRRLTEVVPEVAERFVFYSSSEEHLELCRKLGARCLLKPASLAEVCRAVAEVANCDRFRR
jgi:CheY-like chemotaxis protein